MVNQCNNQKKLNALSYLLNSIIGCAKTIKIQQLCTSYFGVETLLAVFSGDIPMTGRFINSNNLQKAKKKIPVFYIYS